MCCYVFQETVAVLVSHVCFSLVFFVSLFEKNLTYPHLKISISHDGVDVEISNICSLLLCVSGDGGCACVACLFLFCIFFCLFSKRTWLTCTWKFSYLMIGVHVEISNICSLLLFVSENGGCAVVTERRQLLFFCAGVAGSFTSPRHISASVSLIYMHSGWYLTRPSHLY